MVDPSSKLLRLVLLLLWVSCISLGKPLVGNEVSNNETLKTTSRPPGKQLKENLETYTSQKNCSFRADSSLDLLGLRSV